MKILLEKTDEQHPMSIAEIITALDAYGIQAERKSIYTDFELLRQFGLDIETQRSKTTGYYIASRQFELPELKLLVDAVQSSRFITKKKSEELIKKLSSLTSSEQAKQLRRQVYIADRAKTINETVYYSIDQIHCAINNHKKITFKYFDYDVSKNRIYRKQGELYQATPVTLCWNDDNYYLITYNAKYDSLTHYRVDRMSGVAVLDEKGDAFDRSKFNIAEHAKRVFGMFSGEIVRARLSFDNSLVNVVLDHFGKDVRMLSADDGWFDISVDVSISPVFLAWMFTFGNKAVIKDPENLIAAMMERLEKSGQNYLNA
jgi:predicted DNA-binding transcriptional regulator YafY